MSRFEDMARKYGSCMGRLQSWLESGKLAQAQQARNLIETGCFRGTLEDGCSTLILAALAKDLGGKLTSYELSAENIKVCRQALGKEGLSEMVTFVCGGAVSNLARRTEAVDFAYLDSYDCGSGPDYSPCKKHQLAELEAIIPLFADRVTVMMDDNVDPRCNKVELSVKRLQMLGFSEVFSGYQVLYNSTNARAIPRARFAVLCCHDDRYAEYAARTIYHNRAQYCLRHGYDLRVLRSLGKYADNRSHAGGITWARLEEMHKLVQSGNYEWVWCVGTDTLVTNMTIPLHAITDLAETEEAQCARLPVCPFMVNSPAPKGILKFEKPPWNLDFGKKHLLVCAERVTPVQADSFLVRCSPEGAEYLRAILETYPEYKHHTWVENQAMIDLRDRFASITFTVPAWMMNSLDFTRWYQHRPEYRDGTDCFGNRAQWIKGDFLIHWPATSLGERMKLLDLYEPKVVE